MTPTIRPARPDDAAAMAELINAVIAQGGTTAHQTAFDAAGITAHFVAGPAVVACHVAILGDRITGFQSVADAATGDHPLPPGWAEIGTFVASGMQGKGVGKGLFTATRTAVAAAGFIHIDATIRADNFGGLAYYAGLGFRDYRIHRHVPLSDGHCVDRVSKRFDL